MAGWASQYSVFDCASCHEAERAHKGCTLPGYEHQGQPVTITAGGKPWTGCPGSLAYRSRVAQIRRLCWHTQGRLGLAVSETNPTLVEALESYASGQMSAQAAQHKSELERLSNG